MQHNDTTLAAARAYEQAHTADIPANARPLFHLSPRTGWMNDPNGFCYYNGAYHLFYQYHPYNTTWGPMHWGHAVSTDLLRWQYLPAALAPDTPADGKGCFSGSAVTTPDGKLLLLYTGVQDAPAGGTQQVQCVAIGDGTDFEKYQGNPVIDSEALPQGSSKVDFRDPKIWYEDGRYYCVVANLHETALGSALLFDSEDALHWQYKATLDASNGQYGLMWECPDFFALNGLQVLLVSPQNLQACDAEEIVPGYGVLALLGSYDKTTHRFTREQVQFLDGGLDFYAPQTTPAPDGRRIMVAWMENWEYCGNAPRPQKWFGSMTLPRELCVKNGRLYQAPVRELAALWQDTLEQALVVQGEQPLPDLAGRRLDLTLSLDTEKSRCTCLRLRFAAGEGLYSEIRISLDDDTLTFDRSHCGTRRGILHTRAVPFAPQDGHLTLRLILDGNHVELFLNGGERTLTALLETPDTAAALSLFADAPAHVALQAHHLG